MVLIVVEVVTSSVMVSDVSLDSASSDHDKGGFQVVVLLGIGSRFVVGVFIACEALRMWSGLTVLAVVRALGLPLKLTVFLKELPESTGGDWCLLVDAIGLAV